MKNIKFFQTAIVLFLAFTLSSCEEDGPIQFQVVDDFETNATVTGLNGLSSIVIDQSMDITDLLDTGSEFVAADVESVIVTLNDYSGNAIVGNFDLTIGSSNLYDGPLSLTPEVPTSPITIDAANSDILAAISSGIVQVKLNGSTTESIADDNNNFTLNLKFKIKATVQ